MTLRPATALLLALILSPVAAQDAAPPPRAAASVHAPAPAPASAASSTTPAADTRLANLQALLNGRLGASIDPQTLFDVPLDDETAIQVEAARLRQWLGSDLARAPTGPASAAAHASHAAIDPAAWQRRVALDQARLAFYTLDAPRRADLLRQHARLRDPMPTPEPLIDAAQAARAEAAKLLADEQARLSALQGQISQASEAIEHQRKELVLVRGTVLAWNRRVREAMDAGPVAADVTYDALRKALRLARDALDQSLQTLSARQGRIPDAGPNRLLDLPADIPAQAARAQRAAVDRAIAQAKAAESSLRQQQAAALLDEVTALNEQRLRLLPHLSPAKRDAITGFTAAGWEQARAEVRHLALILRYHHQAARHWLGNLRSQGATALSPWTISAALAPLILAVALFTWARRKTPALLAASLSRLEAEDRAARRLTDSPEHRAVQLLSRAHRPIEWLLFIAAVLALLPRDAAGLLEVQLLASIAAWSFAGALVVDLINALFARRSRFIAQRTDGNGRLRLRSLRLVGRTAVTFILILEISTRLVGQGTIHHWTIAACWIAVLPICLILVRRWREPVFARLEFAGKKTPLQAWILANRSGWKSLPAATLGAAQLFATGALRIGRGWLSSFDTARRVHAYFFRREIERIGEVQARRDLVPLPAAQLALLHPQQAPSRWLPSPGDDLVEAITRHASDRQGGLIALVGARGMGKSTLLQELRTRLGEEAALLVHGPAADTIDTLRARLSPASSAEPGSGALPVAVLLDDAQALIQPEIGGFRAFDALIAFAREHGDEVTWVFAFDAAMWPLLARARDARPVFDQVHHLAAWTERQIGALLEQRDALAGIHPVYDELLDKPALGADDIDRQAMRHATRIGYLRMLWNHVAGNPALALEVWRGSLAQDPAGRVHVRPLQVPDMSPLERLPDSALFVLRAVLQLSPASPDAVARTTRLRRDEVMQDFRFGKALGYFEDDGGGVRITWRWLRPVMQILERRRLLETS